MKAIAKKQCKTLSQLAWTVGIRKGPEVEMFTDRRQSFLTALEQQGGGSLAVRDAALDLAEVLANGGAA